MKPSGKIDDPRRYIEERKRQLEEKVRKQNEEKKKAAQAKEQERKRKEMEKWRKEQKTKKAQTTLPAAGKVPVVRKQQQRKVLKEKPVEPPEKPPAVEVECDMPEQKSPVLQPIQPTAAATPLVIAEDAWAPKPDHTPPNDPLNAFSNETPTFQTRPNSTPSINALRFEVENQMKEISKERDELQKQAQTNRKSAKQAILNSVFNLKSDQAIPEEPSPRTKQFDNDIETLNQNFTFKIEESRSPSISDSGSDGYEPSGQESYSREPNLSQKESSPDSSRNPTQLDGIQGLEDDSEISPELQQSRDDKLDSFYKGEEFPQEDEPVYSPSAQEPVYSPSVQEPVYSPSVQDPVYSPSVQEPQFYEQPDFHMQQRYEVDTPPELAETNSPEYVYDTDLILNESPEAAAFQSSTNANFNPSFEPSTNTGSNQEGLYAHSLIKTQIEVESDVAPELIQTNIEVEPDFKEDLHHTSDEDSEFQGVNEREDDLPPTDDLYFKQSSGLANFTTFGQGNEEKRNAIVQSPSYSSSNSEDDRAQIPEEIYFSDDFEDDPVIPEATPTCQQAIKETCDVLKQQHLLSVTEELVDVPAPQHEEENEQGAEMEPQTQALGGCIVELDDEVIPIPQSNDTERRKKQAYERRMQERERAKQEPRKYSPVLNPPRLKSQSPAPGTNRNRSPFANKQTERQTRELSEERKQRLLCNRPRSKNLPNLVYTKPSNVKLIRNAISAVCLAGIPNKRAREEVLDVIEQHSHIQNFLIVFKGNSTRQDFMALCEYDHTSNTGHRIHGRCPEYVDDSLIDSYYRYNTGSKEFK